MELAGLTAIGKELGMSRQGADYTTRQPGFPKPLGKKADNGERIWRMRDVRRYRRTRDQATAKKVDAAKAAAQALREAGERDTARA